MTEQTDAVNEMSEEINHLNRCLSMVLHHEEVQLMVEVIEEILKERYSAVERSGEV